jgi:hypothetical protein
MAQQCNASNGSSDCPTGQYCSTFVSGQGGTGTCQGGTRGIRGIRGRKSYGYKNFGGLLFDNQYSFPIIGLVVAYIVYKQIKK